MRNEKKDDHSRIRENVRALCKQFPGSYWRELDQKKSYPTEFVNTLTNQGFLSVLIPEKYGGSGLGVEEASIILEEIHKSGGNAAACHAQMYTMGTLLRHGSEEQKSNYLSKISSGKLRLQAFGVTEPSSGTDATRIQTTAKRKGGKYVINGQKIWTSRVEHSDLMLLLARTSSRKGENSRHQGLSVFIIDLKESINNGLTIRPIQTMLNHSTTEIFFDELSVPETNLIGQEGEGFRYILDGMNAERILIAAECIGDAKWFIEKATFYANEREVFGRQIGKNQGIQFPISRSYVATEAADLMVKNAAQLFDLNETCGAEANMAKLLASEASWQAAEMCMQTFGGFGFATEFDIERKFRETRLYQVAPISTNLILSYIGEHILDLPRSF